MRSTLYTLHTKQPLAGGVSGAGTTLDGLAFYTRHSKLYTLHDVYDTTQSRSASAVLTDY